MTTPHTPPAALDVAAIRDLMSADEARSLLAAMTPGTLEVAEIRDGRLIDAAEQELAVVIHDDARAHQKPDGTWHSVIVCRGMDGPTRDANAAAFAAVKRALATVAALRAQPVPALDVAAIEARAAAATRAAREYRYCRDCGAVDPREVTHGACVFHDGCRSPNTLTGGVDAVATTHGIVGRGTALELLADNATLLAHITALRAQHAADVAAAVAGERARIVARIRAHADHCNAAAEDADEEGEVEGCDAWCTARDEAVKLADAIAATGGGE